MPQKHEKIKKEEEMLAWQMRKVENGGEELHEIEKHCLDILDEINDKAGEGQLDDWWTRRIKKRLCKLGKNNRCGVNANRCDGADGKEWLFDMMWGESDSSEDKYFCKMPFVMECEWNKSEHEIFWDFEKLLIAKAPHKLFIFQQVSTSKVYQLAEKLFDNIKRFEMKLPEERYLLAGWSGKPEKKFTYYSISTTETHPE